MTSSAGLIAIQKSNTILVRSVCASEAELSGLLTRTATTGKRFVVRADEKLTAFLKWKRRLRIKSYGRGSGVGCGLDVGRILGIGVGRGVAVGLDVAVAVGVGLAVGVAVGVGEGGIGEMIQCITSLFT
jgi:hypothetical protein